MKYTIATIALTVLMITSCGSTKKVASEDLIEVSNEIESGEFLKGQVIFSDVEGDCAYSIKTVGPGAELLDPINLTDEFKIAGQQIWFKYTGLRRANRCEKARPVEINEIKIRTK